MYATRATCHRMILNKRRALSLSIVCFRSDLKHRNTLNIKENKDKTPYSLYLSSESVWSHWNATLNDIRFRPWVKYGVAQLWCHAETGEIGKLSTTRENWRVQDGALVRRSFQSSWPNFTVLEKPAVSFYFCYISYNTSNYESCKHAKVWKT